MYRFNFSRSGQSPMWGLLRPRTNEGVSRLKMSTWYKWPRGEFRTGQTIWRVVVFLLFFIHVSFYIFFILKKTQLQQQTKRKTNTTKKIYRNVEDKSLPIVFDYVLPIRQSSPFPFLFFFSLVLKLYPYLVPFTIKGIELTRSLSFLFYFLFFFLFLPKNKSLSSLSLIWIYKF